MPRLPAPAAAALLLAPVAAAAGTPRFVLPAATEHTPTPWDAESNPPLTPALAARGAVPWSWEPLPDPTAVCLDGSQYGLVICGGAGPYETVTINLQGGGWCYNETDCLGRAQTALGSSKTWPELAAKLACTPQAGQLYVNMWYGDGASFTGYRADPWPVPGNASAMLWFRGARNLDASLDYLFSKYRIADTGLLIVTGGSAGGLATFLHLDHFATRMAAAGSQAVVRGKPVCGFFLDALNDYNPIEDSYSRRLKYVYNMQNSSGSLSQECQAVYGIDAYKCIFAPHASRFIQSSWFALQSRTDTWQLANIAQIPCALNALECNATEWGQIQAYAPQFMDQWLSVAGSPDSHNGGFLDACLIHGSTESTIEGYTSAQAFASWLEGNTTHSNWWTMQCNSSSLTGPCDHGPTCGKFPGNATPTNP